MRSPTLETPTTLWSEVEIDVRTIVTTGMDLLAVALFFFSGKASDHSNVILSLLAPLSNGLSSAVFIYAFPYLDGATPLAVWSL